MEGREMRRRLAALAITVLVLLPIESHSTDFSASALTGYKGGLAFRTSATLSNFAQGFPLGIEFGVGHTRMDPGKPAEARKVFINDATNGTPEESGWAWDFRLDFLYQLKILGMNNAHAYVGVRRSLFTGNFKYIGGNEDFDVTSNQWGWGAGMKAIFPMGKHVGFTLTAGFDHYPDGALNAHDTSYSPDGESVNPRQGYDFKKADDAVNQPKFQGILMAGITLTL